MSDDAIQRRVAEGDAIRISRDFENALDEIHIPLNGVEYSNTQFSGRHSVEIALERQHVVDLHRHLGLWLDATKGIG